MDLILHVAYNILIIGGALCIIILAFVLFVVFQILLKLNYLIKDIIYRYELAKDAATMPFRYIASYLFKK